MMSNIFSTTCTSASRRPRRHQQQQQQQQRQRQWQQKHPINLIGSIIPVFLVFLLSIAVSTTTITTTLALSTSSPLFSSSQPSTNGPDDDNNNNNNNNIIAITHAAGRMGKVLALQLREDAELRYNNNDKSDDKSDDDDEYEYDRDQYLPKIRAIVRSEKEAYSVRCDLGGMTMMNGDVGGSSIAKPNELEWLETVVVDESIMDENERAVLLKKAFEGCRAAILCDASHNELVWKDEDKNCNVINENDHGDSELKVFPDINNDCSEGYSLIVPAKENTDALSRGLLEEIDAASYSSSLEHVILRSTMGLAVAKAAAVYKMYQKQAIMPIESVLDWDALTTAMGGETAISGARNAERAFRKMAEERTATTTTTTTTTTTMSSSSSSEEQQRQQKCKYTILRLGALTDDAGMVPLVFGKDDSILIRTADDGTTNNRPPILSRSDAARLSTFLVRKNNDRNNDDDDTNDDLYDNNDDARDNNNLTTIDCAWHPKFGRDSVGREETISRAGRQDLKKDMVEALLEQNQATINLQQDLV